MNPPEAWEPGAAQLELEFLRNIHRPLAEGLQKPMEHTSRSIRRSQNNSWITLLPEKQRLRGQLHQLSGRHCCWGDVWWRAFQRVREHTQRDRRCINSPSNYAFDFIIGGGLDIPLNKSIAIRAAEADCVLTRFDNSQTNGNNNQSSFRLQAGVIFGF